MRIGMVHQPHFLPWPGYLARCLAADVFVALDDVKFNRNHFQQRTKFIDRELQTRWLSLPIDGSTRSGTIADVWIDSAFSINKWQRPIVESYRNSPDFAAIWQGVVEVIARNRPSFCGISLQLIEFVLDNICESLSRPRVSIVLSSTIESSLDRTQRLVDICRDQQVTHLVMGSFALQSHDADLLVASGLTILNHFYIGSSDTSPAPGVMGLHYIFRDGLRQFANNLVCQWELGPMKVGNS